MDKLGKPFKTFQQFKSFKTVSDCRGAIHRARLVSKVEGGEIADRKMIDAGGHVREVESL